MSFSSLFVFIFLKKMLQTLAGSTAFSLHLFTNFCSLFHAFKNCCRFSSLVISKACYPYVAHTPPAVHVDDCFPSAGFSCCPSQNYTNLPGVSSGSPHCFFINCGNSTLFFSSSSLLRAIRHGCLAVPWFQHNCAASLLPPWAAPWGKLMVSFSPTP